MEVLEYLFDNDDIVAVCQGERDGWSERGYDHANPVFAISLGLRPGGGVMFWNSSPELISKHGMNWRYSVFTPDARDVLEALEHVLKEIPRASGVRIQKPRPGLIIAQYGKFRLGVYGNNHGWHFGWHQEKERGMMPYPWYIQENVCAALVDALQKEIKLAAQAAER